MAKLNMEGAQLTKELCSKLNIPYVQIGAIVLAFYKMNNKLWRGV